MRVVLADDAVLLREGLALLLSDAGHAVVASVGDGPALVAAALDHRPDLVVADVRMPPSHADEGLRAVVELRRRWPAVRALVLSQYVELSYAEELFAPRRGGTGYLLKDRVSDVGDFLAAVQVVADGGTVVDPEVVAALVRRRRDPLAALTPRETETLSLMAQGRSNAAIAASMVITETAVEKYVARVFAKLGLPPDARVHRRVQAVLGWLRAPDVQPPREVRRSP